MGKKRRVWWIVGGLGFVVVFFGTTFLVSWNSPDARLAREVDKVIEEYGFELERTEEPSFGYEGGGVTDYIYRGPPISQGHPIDVIGRFKDACPDGGGDYGTYNQELQPVTSSSDEPTFEEWNFYPMWGSRVRTISIIFDDKGLRTTGSAPVSELRVSRGDDAYPGSFMDYLWPW